VSRRSRSRHQEEPPERRLFLSRLRVVRVRHSFLFLLRVVLARRSFLFRRLVRDFHLDRLGASLEGRIGGEVTV
jgi:hypothetical protein